MCNLEFVRTSKGSVSSQYGLIFKSICTNWGCIAKAAYADGAQKVFVTL